jgi:hypothetical protein
MSKAVPALRLVVADETVRARLAHLRLGCLGRGRAESRT